MKRTISRYDRFCVPKSKLFYEEEAKLRHYFYFMDTRGQIFLEETKSRNIATSIKDVKILNFLIKNMQKNVTNNHSDIPFISYCGREVNYITTQDEYSSLCFKDCLWTSNELIYGGDLKHTFHPFNLVYHPSSGRIYHPIEQHKHLQSSFGLLHPFLCQKIGENIRSIPRSRSLSDPVRVEGEAEEDRDYVLRWNNEEVLLKLMDDNPSDSSIPV